MSDIDALLYRPVLDGKQYHPLIPPSNCDRKDVGKGMTDLSVKEMATMVYTSLIDTAAIAPMFAKSSLKQTCAEIHYFAYNHFQYKADKATQYLRSPSCSWKVRYIGIDCKSYSIIASSILCNLGIIHYIRQIKQPGFMPEMWTHVYVVVPIDQKTGSLKNGYYTIDGTIATTVEPLLIQKSDLKMSMQHYALRGVAPAHTGLNISIGDVKSMFSGGWSPSCIGGTHDRTDLDKTLATIVPWFDDIIYQVNDGIRNNKPIADVANRLLMNTQQIYQHGVEYNKHKWSSSCSKSAVKAYADLGLWYYNIVFKAFLPWLEQYFTISYKTVGDIKRGGYEPDSWFTKTSFNDGVISVKLIASMQMKPTTQEIKRFEITPYVQDTKNQANFDLFKFIGGLTQTLASFNSPAPTTTIPAGNTNTTNTKPIATNPVKFSNQAAIGNISLTDTKKIIDFSGKKDEPKSAIGPLGYAAIAVAGVVLIKAASGSKRKSSKTKTK